jgi:hypothetical protein
MVLVYQAYGRQDVIEQTQFSVVSLLSVLGLSSPVKIRIYTDHPTLFENYFAEHIRLQKVYVVHIQPEQFKAWRGKIDFVHRVKVEVLIHAAKQFNGPLFYVDGDTFFREDPTSLFSKVNDKTSMMHVSETQLNLGSDPLSKKICKFVRKNEFHLSHQVIKMSPQTVMWNAGALGISEKNKELLPLILELTDRMYEIYPKHVMEQLAFSYYLQAGTRLLSGEKEIGHYWNQKDDYQAAIQTFLRVHSNSISALKNLTTFQYPQIPQLGRQSSSTFFNRLSSWLSISARR